MKKLFIGFVLVLAIALICVAVISVYSAVTKPKDVEKDVSSVEEDVQPSHRLDAISKLEQLKKKRENPTMNFPYLEEVVSGTVDPAVPKLDLETAKEIISDNEDFSVILEEILKIQPCPDCVYGSGLSWIEFWFDETGDEKLAFLLEQSQIYYFSLDTDGNRNTEALYDPHR